MADLTLEVAQSHQKAPHQTGFSARDVQPIARKFAKVLKFDPTQPRDEQGQWTKTAGRTFTSEEGYQWHEQGPVAEWAKALPYSDEKEISNYASFGYSDINNLRRGTFTPSIIAHFVRAATEEEYNTSRFTVTDEYIKQHGHPFGKEPHQRKPDDPFERVLDAEGNYVGHIQHNVFYTNPAGEKVEWSVQRAGPDVARVAELQRRADLLDELIAKRGYELPEAIVVQRGAYLPGVSFEQLQDMAYEGPNGEPPAIWEEKGFTSTMVGDAERRAKMYPVLGKSESLYKRFGDKMYAHQDEVGSAIRFHITIPKGTKVVPIEAVRRLEYEFPRIPDPSPRPADVKPEYWTMRDFTATPKVKDDQLRDKHTRTESELLLGSGARFRVTKVTRGETIRMGDDKFKPVEVVEVHMEYIGGGSSEGVH